MSETPPFADAPTNGAPTIAASRTSARRRILPVIVGVGLVLLMDNFRVFEPIIGFSAEAHATSLSWLIYNDLTGQVNQLFGSAAATSILTMLGVIILLLPVLIRTRREFKRKAH